MSLVGIYCPQCECTVERLGETIWLKKNRDAIIRLSLLLSVKRGKLNYLELIIGGNIFDIKDITQLLYNKEYIDYVSKYTFLEEVKIEKVDNKNYFLKGKIKALITLLKINCFKVDNLNIIKINLTQEINEGENVILYIQFKYKKLIKSFFRIGSLDNKFDIKIYSSYLYRDKEELIKLINHKRSKIIEIRKADIWIGIMPNISLLRLIPSPERAGIIRGQHPGYSKKDIKTDSYTGMLWTFENVSLDKNPIEIYCEYSESIIKWWLTLIGLIIGILGLILKLIT